MDFSGENMRTKNIITDLIRRGFGTVMGTLNVPKDQPPVIKSIW